MNEPKKAEKGRCSVCGKFAVIENGVCSLPVCQRRVEEGRVENGKSMSKWQSAETAPKDGSKFVANMGAPWATLAAWNEAEQKYVYVTLEACKLGKGIDVWFENEQAAESELIAWKPLPEIEQ